MPIDPVIQFAQERFGPPGAALIDTERAPILPDWLVGPLAEGTALEGSDPITVEGDATIPSYSDPLADGTTPDNLAFYLPFHFYSTRWGIYMRASGVWALYRRMAGGAANVRALEAARLVLLEHERIHFTAEYAASRIEVIIADSRYREYFRDHTASEHEEALANARALRALRRHHHTTYIAPVAAWMRTQPPGYRDFQHCMPPRVLDAERRAVAFMTLVPFLLNKLSGSHHPAEFILRRSPQRLVPTFWVQDVAALPVRLVRPFPKDFGLQVFVHSNDHNPPHIHIQAPPGKDRTRYRWPALTPLKGDPPLGTRDRRNLHHYVATYGSAIDARVRNIPWQ